MISIRGDDMATITTPITIKKSTYYYLMIYVESYGISLGELIDMCASMIDYPMTIGLIRKAKTMEMEKKIRHLQEMLKDAPALERKSIAAQIELLQEQLETEKKAREHIFRALTEIDTHMTAITRDVFRGDDRIDEHIYSLITAGVPEDTHSRALVADVLREWLAVGVHTCTCEDCEWR